MPDADGDTPSGHGVEQHSNGGEAPDPPDRLLIQPSRAGSERSRTVDEVDGRYAHYVLVILLITYTINFIDRQILSVFIGPIKEEFDVSDTAMGLLVGFAFALFYTVAGIPIARWADRGSRRSIIALGLAVWSAMTVVSGLARNFVQLAIARVGVGIGEAAGSPPAHSLISDYFSPSRRATALGIYSTGVYIGSALAFLGGSYLRENFDWRTAFFVLGAPGLAFALVVRLTVREPPRGSSELAPHGAASTSFRETLRYLLHCRTWVYLSLGGATLSITNYAVLMWGFEFYGRVHGLSPLDIGIAMALIVGLGGSLGTYGGGRFADRLAASDPRWLMRMPALVVLADIPLGFLFLLVTSSSHSLWLMFPFYLLANVFVPAGYALNQNLAKLRMRATATAIVLFVNNIIGAGAGPFFVGLLNDLYTPTFGQEAIRYSLLTVCSTGFLGALFFYLASRHLREDLARVDE